MFLSSIKIASVYDALQFLVAICLICSKPILKPGILMKIFASMLNKVIEMLHLFVKMKYNLSFVLLMKVVREQVSRIRSQNMVYIYIEIV